MDAPEHGDRRALDELAVLADELLEQARAARQRWADLSEALGGVGPTGPAADAAGAAAPPAPPTQAAPAHEPHPTVDGWPVTASAPAAAPAEPSRRRGRRRNGQAAPPPADDADPIRLVTLDMLLSGHTREEVDGYLSVTFGDAYDRKVVDEVFDENENEG